MRNKQINKVKESAEVQKYFKSDKDIKLYICLKDEYFNKNIVLLHAPAAFIFPSPTGGEAVLLKHGHTACVSKSASHCCVCGFSLQNLLHL